MFISACQNSDTDVGIEKQLHNLVDIRYPGLVFSHHNQMDGAYYFHEMMGAGLAVIGVDGDGDLDVYLRQGSVNLAAESRDHLFINQWAESGEVSFVEMGTVFGIKNFGYGMGICVGDYDNNGDSDIFLSNLGADELLENNNGYFTEKPGPWQTELWSTAAVFFD